MTTPHIKPHALIIDGAIVLLRTNVQPDLLGAAALSPDFAQTARALVEAAGCDARDVWTFPETGGAGRHPFRK